MADNTKPKKPIWNQVDNWMFEDRNLHSIGVFKVYIIIRSFTHSSKEHMFTGSMTYLENRTLLSRHGVNDALKFLTENGYIVKMKKGMYVYYKSIENPYQTSEPTSLVPSLHQTSEVTSQTSEPTSPKLVKSLHSSCKSVNSLVKKELKEKDESETPLEAVSSSLFPKSTDTDEDGLTDKERRAFNGYLFHRIESTYEGLHNVDSKEFRKLFTDIQDFYEVYPRMMAYNFEVIALMDSKPSFRKFLSEKPYLTYSPKSPQWSIEAELIKYRSKNQ